MKLGNVEAARADMEAAKAIKADIAAQFASYGIDSAQ
jgi:hypothetical protein